MASVFPRDARTTSASDTPCFFSSAYVAFISATSSSSESPRTTVVSDCRGFPTDLAYVTLLTTPQHRVTRISPMYDDVPGFPCWNGAFDQSHVPSGFLATVKVSAKFNEAPLGTGTVWSSTYPNATILGGSVARPVV
jgi:hypothetical protein